MFFKLLLLFTIVPFLELVILIKLSEEHGVFFTISLIIVTAIIGTILTRKQGFLLWQRIQQEMSQGQPPTDSLVEAGLVLLAGLLLITPGILTDTCGFLLLWPAFRRQVVVRLRQLFATRVSVGRGPQGTTFYSAGFGTSQSPYTSPSRPVHDAKGQEIIDVEFTRKASES